METEKLEKVAVVVGGIGTLALVYFAVQNSKGKTPNTSSVPFAAKVSGDPVAMAQIRAARDTANTNAMVAGFNSLVGFVTADRQFQASEKIAGIEGDVRKYESDNNVKVAGFESEAVKYTAERAAYASVEQSRYQYEATKAQAKADVKKTTISTIGGIVKGIFSLF